MGLFVKVGCVTESRSSHLKNGRLRGGDLATETAVNSKVAQEMNQSIRGDSGIKGLIIKGRSITLFVIVKSYYGT